MRVLVLFPLVSMTTKRNGWCLEFIKKNGSITRKEAEATVDMNQTAAGRLVCKMDPKESDCADRPRKNTKYKLP